MHMLSTYTITTDLLLNLYGINQLYPIFLRATNVHCQVSYTINKVNRFPEALVYSFGPAIISNFQTNISNQFCQTEPHLDVVQEKTKHASTLAAHCSLCGCVPLFHEYKILSSYHNKTEREINEALHIKTKGNICVSEPSLTLLKKENVFE